MFRIRKYVNDVLLNKKKDNLFQQTHGLHDLHVPDKPEWLRQAPIATHGELAETQLPAASAPTDAASAQMDAVLEAQRGDLRSSLSRATAEEDRRQAQEATDAIYALQLQAQLDQVPGGPRQRAASVPP